MKSNNENKKVKVPVIAILAVFMVFILVSCEIDSSLNNSPNAINEESVKTAIGVNGLMIGMQVAAGDFYSGDRSRISSMWTRQMCAPDGLGRPQPVSWNSYQMQTDGFVDDMWLLGFRGIRIASDIINYSPTIDFGENNEALRNTYIGTAKVYKAIILAEMAAFYGSVPIVISTTLEAPQFVTQAQAYDEVQKLLSEALTHFANSGTVAQELNFNGDGAMWIPVINSLKARYYLHVKNYAQALVFANQGISDPTLTLFSMYSDNSGEYSPWGHWCNTEVGQPIRATNTFVNALKTAGDSRLAEYFNPGTAGGEYWGFAYFDKAGADTTNELKTGNLVTMKKYGSYSDFFPLISYNETMFIKAEAKQRGGDGSAVNDLNTILTSFGLQPYAGTDLLGEILKQKYLTLFLEGQSYTDMRRTGTLPSPNVPKRFIYPQSEKNANPFVPLDSDGLVSAILP
ncbi:MAG: SusD/RagB family nutrient-binding outer membrane lipoprotein [Candidatus Kapabacteria bacterium]|nr:SusD/RagB family nutrient-binding outer membrane lipoprotein [Candidatus Kapabacteria bacterium]